jgi:acetoin utilization protein AcuC
VILATNEAVFIYSSELEKYRYPPEHPFNTIRAARVRKVLNSMGLLSGEGRREVAPVPAKRTVLKKFHSARYLHALQAAGKNRWDRDALNMGIGTSDCPIFKGVYEYSVLSAGGTLTGADLILSGSAEVVFNPSGGFHHAGPERAAGFCYINDVALACQVLVEQKKRVLYIDVDVHYGDGVAEAFYDRSDVMTISFHENPRMLFPGTGFEDEIGTGQGEGYCVNVPLPIGTFDEAYIKAFKEIALPLIDVYNPDVFVLQLGADALAGDPLAHLYLTNNAYVEIINRLLSFKKPILATGGGGYNVDNTVRAWALDWTILCGADSGSGLNPALGGVMLESTEWQGGLRDRQLPVSAEQRKSVVPALEATMDIIRTRVFPIHGL